jgi:transposase
MPPIPAETIAACREAVALGLSLKEAAAKYNIGYEAARKRASREKWPTPARVRASRPQIVTAPAAAVVAESWEAKGERLRGTLYNLASTALASATPRQLERWEDIERAARIAERAAGLDKAAQPLVSLHFPDLSSSQSPAFIEFSDDQRTKTPETYPIQPLPLDLLPP